jgi:RNA polymerase sigma-70 factor (ECF subfamily)
MRHREAVPDQPDAAIVRRVLAGDVDAFEQLVVRHAERVRRVVARNARSADVPEIAHEAFVAAYLALPSYTETSSFEHWLVRIALRACADHWRARGRAPHVVDEAVSGELLAPLAPSTDDRELCEWALAQLEREDREVLTLVYFLDYSTKDCAEVLAWSESKVKIRTHRARIRLRRILRGVLPERGRTA